jgi:hypothetical protein
MSRVCLATDETRYLDAVNGDDANDGSTPALAFKTREGAYAFYRDGCDLCGRKVTIQIVGSVTGPCTIRGRLTGQVQPSDFCFFGSSNAWNAPGANVISDTAAGSVLFYILNDAWFGIKGLQLRSSGTGGFGVAVAQGNVSVEDCWIGAMGGAAFDVCGPTSQIALGGFTTWLWENAGAACIAEDHGQIYFGCACYVSGGPSFSNAFVQVDLGGMIDATGGSVPIPGAPHGVKYRVYSEGVIHSNGLVFPGDAAGVNSGGYYN